MQTMKEDGALVGSPEILKSKNVTYSDAVNRPVPVPSVYSDDRGQIQNFSIGNFRVNLLHTFAGVMRSGDIHKGPHILV